MGNRYLYNTFCLNQGIGVDGRQKKATNSNRWKKEKLWIYNLFQFLSRKYNHYSFEGHYRYQPVGSTACQNEKTKNSSFTCKVNFDVSGLARAHLSTSSGGSEHGVSLHKSKWVKHWQNHFYYQPLAVFLHPTLLLCQCVGTSREDLFSMSLCPLIPSSFSVALALCRVNWWFKFWCIDHGNLTLDKHI